MKKYIGFEEPLLLLTGK